MTPELPEDAVERILGPAGPELSCEECFEYLDPFVEIEIEDGEDEADAAVPGMRAHLRGCPACAEDHASLRDLVANELE